ncbi:hypothetical protein KIN20_011942 [Parelaphostrongylus tenuis]|uniref:Thioredoxin domain-containing protein n=1 Tax=Parelaphostrongylus tenuis TaxID=148309 RepID=A0AAD5QK47_PARTN|nr:hypothetical protein KIN20_011942 [Parelaphostrongylus tenuis]
MRELSAALYLSLLTMHCFAQDGVNSIELSMLNHDQVINSSQVVFVAFCADWCPFSRRLKPIFEESARVFKQENPEASVVWAIVDSVRQADVGDKYYVNKYPTMKVFVNGELIQKEYRSTRSVEALTNFVKYQLSTAINEFTSEEQLNSTIDRSKRNIVALVKRGDDVYSNVKKIASLLREDCNFWVMAEAPSTALSEDRLYFIDPDTQQEAAILWRFSRLRISQAMGDR